MRLLIHLILITILGHQPIFSQDTFSIVAVDPETGEVGSAGASCVNLFQTGLNTDDFLGQLIPNVGAINTQAYYIPTNQINATNRMNLGETPSEIIDWLISNDVDSQPQFRQYGIAAIINGAPEVAAHTGSSTDDYKNHIIGSNYAIQGNILLGQQVLDSMESRFLNEPGDLTCKLMAALQGANMVGADIRCTSNGTSSLFAFVKVAQPSDTFGNPSFVASVRTTGNAGIEPIDSLQTKFDLIHNCSPLGIPYTDLSDLFSIFPNPASDIITINNNSKELFKMQLTDMQGNLIYEDEINRSQIINVSNYNNSTYLLRFVNNKGEYTKKIIIDN